VADVKDLVQGFKQFVLRGNVVDLAVAVVIGGAFMAVVTSFVKNIVLAIVSIIFGKPDFSSALILTINHAHIRFGAFLTDVISFLILAVVVYFFVVVQVNALLARFSRGEEVADAPDPSVELLGEIRDLLAARR